MTMSIEDQEAESLARRLASLTGQSLVQAVRGALRVRLSELQSQRGARPRGDAGTDGMVERFQEQQESIDGDAIDAIIAEYNALPVYDTRTADEIIGYDENGLPS